MNQNDSGIAELQKSIIIFINAFICLVILDTILIYFFKDLKNLISSATILAGLFISKSIISSGKLDIGIALLCIVFYIDGLTNAFLIGNYITLYFILLCAPIISCIVIDNVNIKIVLISISIVIFLLSNYFLGFHPFSNYHYFFGLIPGCLLMIHFYNKLKRLNIQNSRLIKDLNQSNEELIVFTHMMSHDLKSPLKTISSFSQLLKKKYLQANSEETQYLNFITGSTSELTNLIDSLLQYSKLNSENVKLEKIDLEKLVAKVIGNLDFHVKEKKVQFIKNIISPIKGHESSLYLLFQNLISNAIKFQPKDETHIPKIRFDQYITEKSVELVIEDNGIGMEEDQIKDIFEPFKKYHSKSEYQGSGLGMSIVKKIIEKHGGTISISSEVGKGSLFKINLPT